MTVLNEHDAQTILGFHLTCATNVLTLGNGQFTIHILPLNDFAICRATLYVILDLN